MAFQIDERSWAQSGLFRNHLGNSPQFKAIDYSNLPFWPKRAFLVSYLETKSTGLTLLEKGSYAHAAGIRPSNLGDTAVASLAWNAEFCANLLFCNH